MAAGTTYDAGVAWLQILPSFEDIDGEIKKAAKQIADGLDKSLSDAMPNGVKASAKATAREAQRAGGEAGEKAAEGFAGHFASTLDRRLRNAYRSLPEVPIDADASAFDKAVAKVRKDIEDLRSKKLGVDLTPEQAIGQSRDISGRLRNLRAQTGDSRMQVDLSQAADEVDAWVEVAQAGGEKLAVEAKRSADEWNRIHQSALDENLRRERKAAEERLRVHQHALDEDLRRTYLILQEQGRIHDQAIQEDLRRDYLAVRERTRLHEAAAKEDFLRDQRIRQNMAKLQEQAMAEDFKRTRQAAASAAKVAEEEFGRTWAGKIQAEISKAFQSLPDLGLRPARDEAEQLVKDIRGRLETLRNQRIGVDIDAGAALAEVATLRGMLAQLARSRTTVEIQADAIDAAAKLTLVERMAERLDGRKVDIKIDADASKLDGVARAANFSLSRLESLTFIGLSLGTTLIPAAGAVASAIGFIGTAAVSAAAGIGVLALGFSGVGDAVKALNKFQQDSQKSAVAVAAAQDRVTSATDSVASAQRSLANARATAASGARRAAQQVADAERGVGDARREAGEAAQQAARRVADAQRSLADARRAVAEQVKTAVERVGDAEEDLARANVDAREAREALTESYRDAAKALADLDSAIKDNALDQRQATLDIKEAKAELDKFLTNPRATQEEREQARITYERRVQQIQDLQRKGRELAAEQADAAKMGVAGSDQVVAARKRLADAEGRVADAQKSVADARTGLVRAQLDGARRVADAQRSVADAQAAAVRASQDGARRIADAERRVTEARVSQAEQQRQSTQAILSAQQGLVSAQRQLRQAIDKTSVAGGESLSNLQKAMDNLTPTGQAFAKFIFSLKPEFDRLRAAASDNLLPGVQSSIENLLPILPRFRDFVGRTASAIGGLFDSTTKFLTTDPTWRRFWGYVDGTTVPTLQRLYRIAMNTATGVIGLFMAFTPFNDDIGGGLERLTERFATWSASLQTNQGFQKLLGYIRENSPAVIDLVGQLLTFTVRFIEAAAPIGTVVVQLFDSLFSVLNALPMPVLSALVLGMAALATAILAVNTAMRLTAITKNTFSKFSGVFTTIASTAQDAMGLTTRSTDGATRSLGRMEKAAGRTKLAGLKMRDGLSAVGGFLTGPWGVALGGAAIAIGYLASKQAEQKQKVKDLSTALGVLGDAYKQTGRISSDAVQDVVAQNEKLQELINSANTYGVSINDIAAASAGEEAAQARVLQTLEAKRAALEHLTSFEGMGGDRRATVQAQEDADAIGVVVAGLRDRFAKTNAATAAQKALDQAQRNTTANTPAVTNAQKTLGDAMKVLSDNTSTAAEKVQALKSAEDALYGGAKTQTEAEEAYEAALDNVTGALTAKNHSLDKGTAAGRSNRDAVQALLDTSVDMYNADRAAGVSVEEATRRHNERIAALRTEADKVDANKTETEKLIATYGRVPDEVSTLIAMTGDVNVDKKLADLAIRQKALYNGISMVESKRLYEKDKRLAMMASGGLLRGPGTGTSDDILLWGSDGEFMQRADAVKHYGVGFMRAINERRIPKEVLPGFAKGGLIRQDWPFNVNVSGTKIPDLSANPPRTSGGIGSADMMKILRRVFSGLSLLSGYRPGSRTNSGALSYHGRKAKDGDPGRAVDVPPRMDVFNWLTRNYPDSREIIYTPAGARQVWNGHPHVFQDPFVRRTHFNHLHWAYDEGGYLPTGVSTVFNGTGKPEPVFTDGQWDQIATLVRNNHAEPRGGGETHNWYFREAALDHGRLNAWADARDAAARIDRPY